MAAASLSMTPSGYKAGKLYSELPIPEYGAELVNSLSEISGAPTVNDEIVLDGLSAAVILQKRNSFVIGKTYIITMTISEYTSGRIALRDPSNTTILGTNFALAIGLGQFIWKHTYTDNDLYFRCEQSPNLKISSISAKEVIVGSGDFTVERNSKKTRINSLGVIETLANNVPSIDYTDGGCPVLLIEPVQTQIYELTETMSTQTKTTAASDYTVGFYGTGTITFSGSYVGSLVGTGVNDRVELTFTATAASLISTVSGSVTKSQLVIGSYLGSYIPNTGTGLVTRLADVITLDTASVTGTITSITETIDGITQTPITVIPTTYTIPQGKINQIIME
tara:strand:+ start:220 stop:1230 length:1011 start_codon:yes stop_codon:yes gene_type:complete